MPSQGKMCLCPACPAAFHRTSRTGIPGAPAAWPPSKPHAGLPGWLRARHHQPGVDYGKIKALGLETGFTRWAVKPARRGRSLSDNPVTPNEMMPVNHQRIPYKREGEKKNTTFSGPKLHSYQCHWVGKHSSTGMHTLYACQKP